MKEADKIRQYVLEKIIIPARKNSKKEVKLCARDIHDGLGYSIADHRFPNIIQAIEGEIFQELAKIEILDKIAPSTVTKGQSSTICWLIKLK